MAAKLIEEYWGAEEDDNAVQSSTNNDGSEFDFNPNGAGGNGNLPISF